MANDFDKILEDLQPALAQELLDRIKNGEATAADLNVARGFLKDNNVQGKPNSNNVMLDLLEAAQDDSEFEGIQTYDEEVG